MNEKNHIIFDDNFCETSVLFSSSFEQHRMKMKLLVCLNLLAVYLATIDGQPESHFIKDGRIVGGNIAAPNQFPHQAGLKILDSKGTTRMCGGSLIKINRVLTSAACLYQMYRVEVHLGSNKLFNGYWRGTFYQSSWIIHPNFNSTTLANNIALIKIPYIVDTGAGMKVIQSGISVITNIQI